MRLLVEIKNRIADVYYGHTMIIGAIARFIVAIIVLFTVRNNIGFNSILTNFIFVILFCAACAFVPVKLMLIALAAYSVVQVFSLTSGLGLVAAIICLIMYLLFFRFDSERGYVILLIPILCMLKLPILIPLVLAVTAPLGSVIGVLCGLVAYYFLHYVHIYAAVYQGLTDSGATEFTKMSMAVQDLFTYTEMLYTIVCILIMFAAAYYIKKIHINSSNQMAMSIGAGIYLITIIICTLLFGTITYQKLLWYVIGTIISLAAAMIIAGVAQPLDYKRTELFEFEDEEYKYYVRAVPKAQVARESVRIKRIYSRKKDKS